MGKNKADQVIIRAGSCAGGIISHFGRNASFDDGVVFSLASNDAVNKRVTKSIDGYKYQYAPTFKLHLLEGWLEFQDAYFRMLPLGNMISDFGISAKLRLIKSIYSFHSIARTGGILGDIELTIERPAGIEWPAPKIEDKVVSCATPHGQRVLGLLELNNHRSQWSTIKAIKFIMVRGEKCRFFNVSEVMRCLETFEAKLPVPTEQPIRQQGEALKTEAKAKAAQLARLARRSISVSIFGDARWPGKAVVRLPRLTDNDKRWDLKPDHILSFSEGDVFGEEAETPNKKGGKEWVGRVASVCGDSILAVLENEPYNALAVRIIARIDGVNAEVSEEELVA